MNKIIRLSLYVMLFVIVASCVREPPLHLHKGQHIVTDMPIVDLDLDVMWNYDIEMGYDWRTEWTYGWDDEDHRLFGELGYTDPEAFDIRRYYLNQTPHAPHTQVDIFDLYGTHFEAEYKYGYYDLLTWNKIFTPDGVQSVAFDETTLDSVMVYTNNTNVYTRYDHDFHFAPSATTTRAPFGNPDYNYAFNMPEHVFAAYARDVYISPNPEDYDGYDPERHVYYKHLDMLLTPVTYIYLTQVRLHHNNGRIEGVDGNANISGMARGACLNSGFSAHDPITVHYQTRFKRDVVMKTPCNHHGGISNPCATVDIAGGRVVTFGIPNQNSSRVSRADQVKDDIRHYLDMTLLFNNGFDSTFVFDVTDQVRALYRGGVITIDLDVDTVPIPQRPGGSGFDAVVDDWEDETHEFDMSGAKPMTLDLPSSKPRPGHVSVRPDAVLTDDDARRGAYVKSACIRRKEKE